MSFVEPANIGDPVVTVRVNAETDDLQCIAPRWRDIENEPGDGSLTLQIFDEGAAVSDGDLVTARVNGSPAWSMRAKRFRRRTIDPIDARRTVTVSGEGHLSDWDDWIIETPLALGVPPEAREVRYDWTTCDISAWDACTVRGLVGDRTALPPEGLGGGPLTFPNGLANWIAPRASAAGPGADPEGVFYVARTFTTVAEKWMSHYWIADDLADVAQDGAVIDTFQRREQMASYQTHHRMFQTVPAGTHTLRAKIENLDRPHAQNCGLFAMATAYRALEAGGWGIEEDWSIVTNADWKSLDYGEPEPGWTWGAIIDDFLTRAQAASMLTGWTIGFDATEDSAGNAWPTVQQRFKTGMSLLDAMRQGIDARQLEIRARPGELVLDAWIGGGRGTVTDDVIYSDCRDIEHDEDFSSVTGRILVRDDNNRLRWVGSSGPAGYVELGGIDAETAVDATADAMIDRLDESTLAVTLTHVPADIAASAYGEYEVGDTMGVPNTAVSGHDDLRCVEIDVNVVNPRQFMPVVKYQSRRRQELERVERAARRSTPGVRGETAAPVTGNQPAPSVVELFAVNFSWSGKASNLNVDGLISAPLDVQRPLRIQRMVVRCNDDGGGSVDSEFDIYADFSPLPLAIGELTLADNATYNDKSLLYLAQPGQVIHVVITTPGEHTTGSVQLTGGFVPM